MKMNACKPHEIFVSCETDFNIFSEFSQGMILPSKGSNENRECKDSINNISSGLESKVKINTNAINAVKSAPNIKGPGHQINTTNIELSQIFQCSAVELYKSLTLPEVGTEVVY